MYAWLSDICLGLLVVAFIIISFVKKRKVTDDCALLCWQACDDLAQDGGKQA